MKNLIKSAAILFLIFGLSSCMYNGVKGDGNVVSNNRKISDDFVRIEASRGLDVYITKSKKMKLVVEADENLHELIETDVREGTLYITASKNIYAASAKKIHLSVDFINEIKVSSGAEVFSENTFTSEKLAVNASSGAQAKLDLQVDELHCESSSGAEIKLIGEANNFDASSSSGSEIEAYGLTARNCNAQASSGSDMELMVTEVFVGKATSGGDIKFKGRPKKAQKNNNSGGSVRSIDG
jgi:hypothetical protein